MHPTLIGFAWAILSALLLGTGTFLYKISSRALGASNTTFFYYLFSMALAALVWVVSSGKETVHKPALLWPALMALFLSASVWTFSSAVRTLDMSTASTIRGLSFIPAVVLAIAFYGERPGPRTVVAICMIIVAVVLLGFETAGKGN